LSLRAALLLLLFANLAFFGWAHLVDVEPEPLPDDSIEHLPKLKLLGEAQSKPAAQEHSVQSAIASPPASSVRAPVSSASVSSSGGSASNRTARNTAPLLAQSATAPPSAQRCVTVGPFNDSQGVDQAADLLRQRGFKLRERTEQAQAVGYWVYVGGLKSGSDESSVVRRLQQNGVTDAHVMPESDKGRRVSVGFFTERDGAERRARAVRGLGLQADIEKRTQSSPAHWVDVNIDSSTQSLPTEGLLGLEEIGARLEIKECPADENAGGGSALSAKTVAQAQPPPGAKAAAAASP
jgi:SPOR domain